MAGTPLRCHDLGEWLCAASDSYNWSVASLLSKFGAKSVRDLSEANSCLAWVATATLFPVRVVVVLPNLPWVHS